MHKDEQERRRRYNFYKMIVLITLCVAAGRICSVISKEGDTAFLSANDRSRWCTITALVEDGSYEIDRYINHVNKKRRRPWYTIDLVRHQGDDGEQHYYSSKPPLYPTMIAGVYKVLNLVSGLKISEQPIYVPRILLLIINLPLLGLFCWCTIRSIDLVTTGRWARRFAAVCVCFGTMLLPFSLALNNHLPAAAATALAMCLYLLAAEKLVEDSDSITSHIAWWHWFVAGIAAAFAAANELPALSMLGLWFVLVFWLDKKATVLFSLGVVVVAAAFFATNWQAHKSLRPPYAHRSDGGLIVDLGSDQPDQAAVKNALIDNGLIAGTELVRVSPSGKPDRLVAQVGEGTLFAVAKDSGGEGEWRLKQWDDWYDYPGSYWRGGKRRGVDLGESSRLVYLANMTFGHYGIFSITPIFLLMPFGFFYGSSGAPMDFLRLLFAIGLASVVCLLFYLMRPEIDRNYGGVSACFRWMLWFAPLWMLLVGITIASWERKRELRMIMIALMCASIFSVAVSLDSPWQSPWIYRFWTFLGWIGG